MLSEARTVMERTQRCEGPLGILVFPWKLEVPVLTRSLQRKDRWSLETKVSLV